MSDSSKQRKRQQHVPVPKAQHVYYTVRAGGEKVYEVRHPKDAEGRRRYETVGTSLGAARARANEVHGKGAPRIVSLTATFAEAVADWRENRNGLAPGTLRRYDGVIARHVLPLIGREKVKDIDTRTYMRLLAGGRMAYVVTLVVLKHAHEEMGVLGSVPKLPKGKAPARAGRRERFLSADEEMRLRTNAKARKDMLAEAVEVALGQALRIGEVAGLRWEDVNFVTDKLTVARSWTRTGRSGSPRARRRSRSTSPPRHGRRCSGCATSRTAPATSS
jgi:integrase